MAEGFVSMLLCCMFDGSGEPYIVRKSMVLPMTVETWLTVQEKHGTCMELQDLVKLDEASNMISQHSPKCSD